MSKLIDEAEDAMLSVLGAGLDKNKELKRQARRVKRCEDCMHYWPEIDLNQFADVAACGCNVTAKLNPKYGMDGCEFKHKEES